MTAYDPHTAWPEEYAAAMGEEWRKIPGFDERYEVSNLGRVRSWIPARSSASGARTASPRIMTQRVSPANGYVTVGLSIEVGRQGNQRVHGLVMAAFAGPRPDGYDIAHGDGDKTNNHIDNLRYATRSENALDKREHGTMRRGEQVNTSKLTAEQVAEIVAALKAGQSKRSLSIQYGVCRASIQAIALGKSWAHLGLTGGAA